MIDEPVRWPAIIVHAGDPELVLVDDQSVWDACEEMHAGHYQPDDCLVDVGGQVFRLVGAAGQGIELQASGETLPLVEVLGLVKAHAAHTGSCCVAKLYAATIADAFHMLASLGDDA
jgi:hypothetical protein